MSEQGKCPEFVKVVPDDCPYCGSMLISGDKHYKCKTHINTDAVPSRRSELCIGREQGIKEERERFTRSYNFMPKEMYYLQTDSGKLIPQMIPSPSYVDRLLTHSPKGSE